MPSCLGIYVQNNLIKYAKISKDHDIKKVDSFGVKFYDNDVEAAIKQVIEETYSYKTPISLNLEGETYKFFDMFALLNKKDLGKAIKTEFDMFCNEKGYNPNVFETRYTVSPNMDDKQKISVIHVSSNKIELNRISALASGYRLAAITPISMAITNLEKFNEKQNCLIVNIEDHTTITTLMGQTINDVQIFEQGSREIIDKISLKENSYSKSYEMCKNTTIYTSEGKDLLDSEVSHLEDIMPTLYSIVGQVQKVINSQVRKIDKVYITGTAALINNIDLYFQEYLEDIKCEILKPYFITNTRDISIKEYMEVNSAISLALSGLDEGIKGMNFKNKSFQDSLPEFLKTDIGPKKDKESKNNKFGIKFDLGEKLDKVEKNLLRGAYTLLILFIVYGIFSSILKGQYNNKEEDTDARIASINSQIALAKADDNKINKKTSEYTNLIKNLQSINDKVNERLKTRNAIPNLLEQIMFIIPENVQITSIQNTSDRHIEIYAQSDKYEQLGYLKAKIKSENYLTDVISTAGQKESNVVTVKIEGELP
ncbi:MAG: hypothetical protein J6N78_04290 [Clostridia bacterium]|nr:hypothetical protein [Clostridia bacterium]